MNFIHTFYLIASIYFGISNAAKILGISFFPAKSHQNTFQPIWRELSLRGHIVTVITPVPMRDPALINLTEIDISHMFDVAQDHDFAKEYATTNWLWDTIIFVKKLLVVLMEKLLNDPNVQELIRSDRTFDVIIVEPHHPVIFAFGERFKAPVIGLSSLNPQIETHDIYGNPAHPLISPEVNMPVSSSPNNHPISVRMKSVYYNVLWRILYYWYYLPTADGMARKYFGKNIPYLGEICKKYSSILLMNNNLVTNPVRATVPTVQWISQLHIKEKRPLPQDLLNFLDASKNGVVYFSLGSTIPSTSLDNRTLNEVIGAFSQLPFNVLWKWESDTIPDVSNNVLIRKFFPQQDLLAHPNIKVFVTQGGVHSIEEAIHREVPMVGIPLIVDQPMNIKRVVELGLGVGLSYVEMTRDSLVAAILEVAGNESYKLKVRELKSVLEDQPLKGVEKAIWWIEYVIRHKGASYLKSSAVDMPSVQYFLLDVVAVSCIILLSLCYIIYKLLQFSQSIYKRKSKRD